MADALVFVQETVDRFKPTGRNVMRQEDVPFVNVENSHEERQRNRHRGGLGDDGSDHRKRTTEDVQKGTNFDANAILCF